MIFAHPGWLLAGACACGALIWTWRSVDARQRRALEQFVAPQLRAELTGSLSRARVLARRALYASAVALLFAALAEPQAGFHWEPVTRRGNDIIFAVDTSRSMLTPDVKPNRLTRAKLAIDDFVSRLDGDAVGLVAFAGSAFLQSPITLDYGAFRESLAALDTHIIPRGGTDITSAIQAAQAGFKGRAGSDKILILVTDGEDLEGDSLTAAKAAARQDGMKIYTVGVGSANGDLIPLPADEGGGFLKDTAGRLVKSRLDESALKSLAAATGGMYVPLGSTNQGLDTLYDAAIAPLAKHDLSSKAQKVYNQRFQWPLGASLALLMASLLVGTRRRTRWATSRVRPSPPPVAGARPWARHALPAVAVASAMGSLIPIHAAHASVSGAASAYARGDFAKAAQEYSAAVKKDPAQPILQFDAGTAAYRAGEFAQAAQAFQASVDAKQSGSGQRLAEQGDAYYNLGNTLYREGQQTSKSDATATIKTWTQAVKVYDAALQLHADDPDTKFNRDFVSRKLDELKKQQQAQSKQDQSKQDQSKQDQSKQDQSKQPSQTPGSPKPQTGQDKPQAGAGQQAKAGAAQGKESPQTAATTPSANGSRPNGSQPRPDRAQGAAGGQMVQAAEDQRQPGGMSQQEARELLDSVKSEEKHAPGVPVARNSTEVSAPDEPLKDW
jgi:Ca-activated chloride channel family protein